MSEQQSLFGDPPPPRKRRRRTAAQTTSEAIRTVDEHADAYWKTVADQCAYEVAQREIIVLAEMVRHELEKHPYAQTHQLRAIGPVMLRAQKNGWIRKTPNFARCADETQHATPHVVWLSLICQKKTALTESRIVKLSEEACTALRTMGFSMEDMNDAKRN